LRSLLSSNPRILFKLTLERTSNSLAFDSSSSRRLLLVFLYYNSFCFSLPSFLMSSFNLSIIFSWVAISCWARSISCLSIFSRFSDSASCSQSVVLEVSYYLRLSIWSWWRSFIKTSCMANLFLCLLKHVINISFSFLISDSIFLRFSNSSRIFGSTPVAGITVSTTSLLILPFSSFSGFPSLSLMSRSRPPLEI